MDSFFDINIPFSKSVSIISIFVSVFFLLYLLNIKSRNKKSNQFLSFFFFLLVSIQLFLFSTDINFVTLSKFLLIFFLPSCLFLAPIFYLYVFHLIEKSTIRKLYHFIIPLAFLIINLIGFLIIYYFEKFNFFNLIIELLTIINIIGLTIVFIGLNVFYIYKSIKLLKRHKLSIDNHFSYNPEAISLKWVNFFIIGYIIFLVIIVISHFLPNKLDSLIIDLIILSLVTFIGYFGGKQKEIFYGYENSDIILIQKNSDNEKADIKVNEELKEKLIIYINTNKPYLNHNLTIIELAKELKTNQKYLSSLINNEFKLSFVSFINNYRLEEALKLLKSEESKTYTIETIANMAGFRSKSSFYNYFKKIYNKTPNEYLKNFNS